LPDGQSAEWQAGFNHAMQVVSFWLEFQQRISRTAPMSSPGLSRIGMAKSALLGRLMRGEEVRRRPCPRHKGTMWCSWGLEEAMKPCACQGTGWLPNEGTPEAGSE
jgi:hypothetical protein